MALPAVAALHTMETDTWSTPRASDGAKGSPGQAFGGGGIPLPAQAVKVTGKPWPTPAANEGQLGYQRRPPGMASLQNQQSLSTKAVDFTEDQNWPTPQARDFKGVDRREFRTHNQRPLNEVVANWGSPAVADSRGSTGGNQVKSLRTDAKTWDTPSVASATGGQISRGGERQDELLLGGQAIACTLQVQETPTPGPRSSEKGPTLNPRFVEWMMGWPPGWTDFACSETVFIHWKAHMGFALSRLTYQPPLAAQPSLFD